jgi:acetyl esterase/lipase
LPTFDDVSVERDLSYGDTPSRRLDLYQPAGDTAPKRPVLIWVHGGGFSAGDKTSGPLIALPTTFARLGYVTVSIDYQLLASLPCIADVLVSEQCSIATEAALRDAQEAVRWLRANAAAYRIDPDRIAIAGESAGAITATYVGTRSEPGAEVRAFVSVAGGEPNGGDVDRSDAPGLLISGSEDPWIPHQWSVDTAAAMRIAGVPVVLKTLDGEGHVPIKFLDLYQSEARDFLYEQLALGR